MHNIMISKVVLNSIIICISYQLTGRKINWIICPLNSYLIERTVGSIQQVDYLNNAMTYNSRKTNR